MAHIGCIPTSHTVTDLGEQGTRRAGALSQVVLVGAPRQPHGRQRVVDEGYYL